jgi:hypothetical protein
MFGSAVLEVTVGLVFLYLVLSLLCTAANEWIATVLQSRAKLLRKGITQLLITGGASSLADKFYSNPLIRRLSSGGRPPGYIESGTFVKVLIDTITSGKGAQDLAQLQAGIASLPDGPLRESLTQIMRDGVTDLATAKQTIEGWYEETMDRVTGWFKRHTQLITVGVAAFVTIFSNADTIAIANRLYGDVNLRAQVAGAAAAAQAVGVATQAPAGKGILDQVLGWTTELNSLNPGNWLEWTWERTVNHSAGWLLTVLALSLGAPFWFDMLKQVINIRGAGLNPREKAQKEGVTPS